MISNSIRFGNLSLLYFALEPVDCLNAWEYRSFCIEGWQLPAEPVSEVDHHLQS